MRRTVLIVMVLVFARGAVMGNLQACGDKFLVLGRGVHYQRTPAERQASTLLIYAPPASELSRSIGKFKVDASMRKVGYRPTVVTTEAEFDRAAAAARWDIVVADVADGATVSQRFRGVPLTHVVAVAQSLTGVQAAEARAKFPWLLKAPSRAQDFLDAIDLAGVCARADAVKAQGKGH